MGLFDSLVKLAKNTVNDVAGDVVKDFAGSVIGNVTGKQVNGANNERDIERVKVQNDNYDNTQEQRSQQSTESYELRQITIPEMFADGGRTCHTQVYQNDDADNEKVIILTYDINSDYHKSQSYAAEVDEIYVYAPQAAEDEEVEQEDFNIPYIFFGVESRPTETLDEYLENGSVRSGDSVEQVEGSFVKYRTRSMVRMPEGQNCYLCYHYHMGFDKDIYRQIGISYPAHLANTPEEQRYIDRLNAVVNSYRESVSDEWDNNL